MNKRLKELAERAGLITRQDIDENNQEYFDDLERFAELVRQDERERVYNSLISGDCDGNIKAYIRKILGQGTENQ